MLLSVVEVHLAALAKFKGTPLKQFGTNNKDNLTVLKRKQRARSNQLAVFTYMVED